MPGDEIEGFLPTGSAIGARSALKERLFFFVQDGGRALFSKISETPTSASRLGMSPIGSLAMSLVLQKGQGLPKGTATAAATKTLKMIVNFILKDWVN